MADTHDTIDGLLAEFRGYSAGMPASYHVTMSWADFRKMLDRFDAAHKLEIDELMKTNAELAKLIDTEKMPPINAAKLREAVCEILSYIESFHKYITPGKGKKLTALFAVADTIRNNARAALAAPPRNCDKYATADEALKAQEQMFNDSNFANGECKLGCPECDNPRVGCKIAWLYAPTTEQKGGVK